MGRLSLATWLYVAAVVAGAAVIFVAKAPVYSAAPQGFWITCGSLALLFLICDSTPTVLADRQWAWSPSSAATLAAVVLLGHYAAVGAAIVGSVAVFSVRRPVRFVERLFNGAMYAIAGYAAGTTFWKLHGRSRPLVDIHALTIHHLHPVLVSHPADHPFATLWLPFAAAAVVHMLVNHGLLWGVLLIGRTSRPSRKRGTQAWSLPLLLASDLGFAALGLVIAALWTLFGPIAEAIVLVPLYVARWAMNQFAEHQRAHDATVRTLCQAVETKDFYTRGHSERVSRGAGMIARQIGMRTNRAEAVRFAGMLHDVGKLGVPTRVLQKEGRLTEEEYAAIQLHPMRGLEIVRDIGFLNEALTGIMHHHERMDGRGYPMGFAGNEIPEFARIIAVADAFDSMTSTRAYRKATKVQDAIAELRKGADSQFDPKFVEAFIAALEREGWQAQQPARPRGYEIFTSQDHDDPTAPIQVMKP